MSEEREFARIAEREFVNAMADDTVNRIVARWRPIETAPKDGTQIIVGAAGTPMRLAVRWWPGIGWSVNGKHTLAWETAPTHWMPLPAPPEGT